MVSLGDALRTWMRVSGLEEQMRHQRVYTAWNEALGRALAPHARPVRFRAGELWVDVDSSAYLHDFTAFTGEQYRNSANERLGRAEIRSVRFQLKR